MIELITGTFVCPFIRKSVSLCLCLCASISICMTVSICLCVCLSVHVHACAYGMIQFVKHKATLYFKGRGHGKIYSEFIA